MKRLGTFLFVCIFWIFGFSLASQPNLYITEVYFDGRDEFIEIYNANKHFSGTLNISGASIEKQIQNISIQSGQTLIITDNERLKSFSGISNIYHQDSLINLSDSSPLNLKLIYSGRQIDTFPVSQAKINNIDNTNKSIEKKMTDSGFVITGTTKSQIQNISGSIIANPGYIDFQNNNGSNSTETKNENKKSENSTGTQNNTGFQKNIEYQDIHIQEVHPQTEKYLGEYIKLKSNINYDGTIKINGLGRSDKNKKINININSGQNFYIAGTTQHIDSGQNIYKKPDIGLTDGGENLSVYITGQKTDQINYQGDINTGSFYFSSQSGDIRLFTGINTSSLSYTPPLPNNCSIIISNQEQLNNKSSQLTLMASGVNNYRCNKPTNQKRTINNKSIGQTCNLKTTINTGSYNISYQFSGKNKTICSDNIKFVNSLKTTKPQKENTNQVQITEINPQNSQLPEYIEIYFQGQYSGQVQIHGLGRGGSKEKINLKANSKQYIYISDNASGFNYTGNLYLLDSISLKDQGQRLKITNKEGKTLDKTVYKNSSNGKALTFKGVYSGEHRLANQKSKHTPGFANQIKKYFKPKQKAQNTNCSLILQNNQTFFNNNSINLITNINDQKIQNSNNDYKCQINYNNSNKSTKCNPGYYEYSKPGIKNIKLKIYNSNDKKICQDRYQINLPKKSTTNCSTNCEEDYYKHLYNKRKKQTMDLKDKIENKGYNVTRQRKLEKKEKDNKDPNIQSIVKRKKVQTGSFIKLKSILPDPQKYDREKEGIQLTLSGKDKLSLSGYKLKIDNKDPKNITGFLSDNQKKYDNRKLTNNGYHCAKIIKKQKIKDKICYHDPKEGKRIKKSVSNLSRFKWNQLKKLNLSKNLKLKTKEKKICIKYKKMSISCQNLSNLLLKHTNNQQENKKNGPDSNGQLNSKKSKIQIKSILPDPKGADKNKEKITLQKANGETNLKSFKLTYNNTTFNLTGKLKNEKTIQNNFQFLNTKPSCVRLKQKKQIHDKICYLKANDQEKIKKNNKFLSELSKKELNIFKDMNLKRKKNQVCIYYDNQRFKCNNTIKNLQKQINELNQKVQDKEKSKKEAIKKCESEKDTIRGRYKNKKNDYNTYKDKCIKRKKQLRNKVHFYQNSSYMFIQQLKDNWPVVYKKSDIKNSYKIYRNLKEEIQDHIYKTNIYGLSVDTSNIQRVYELKSGKIKLKDYVKLINNRIEGTYIETIINKYSKNINIPKDIQYYKDLIQKLRK